MDELILDLNRLESRVVNLEDQYKVLSSTPTRLTRLEEAYLFFNQGMSELKSDHIKLREELRIDVNRIIDSIREDRKDRKDRDETHQREIQSYQKSLKKYLVWHDRSLALIWVGGGLIAAFLFLSDFLSKLGLSLLDIAK